MGSFLSTGADKSLEWIINCLLNSSGLYPKTAEFTKLDNPMCFASLIPFMTFSIKHRIPARWENKISAFRISGFWNSVFFKMPLAAVRGFQCANLQMCKRNCLNVLQSIPTNHLFIFLLAGSAGKKCKNKSFVLIIFQAWCVQGITWYVLPLWNSHMLALLAWQLLPSSAYSIFKFVHWDKPLEVSSRFRGFTTYSTHTT